MGKQTGKFQEILELVTEVMRISLDGKLIEETRKKLPFLNDRINP